MGYQRLLDLRKDIEQKSLFLFGPRQTGKTFLLHTQFPKAPFYNLLQADTFYQLSQRPQLIREEQMGLRNTAKQPIIIDEIQKLPILLDEVHTMIESTGQHFILTGSSPRKLLRGGANLLGGRAWTRHLFPLVSKEVKGYDLLRILNYGSLPFVYDAKDPEQELESYVGNYLKEEIQAEGLVRKVEQFARFLQTASLVNTELLNFSNVASDAGVPPRTIREYFGILQDTLVGSLLTPYVKTQKRKAIETAKFYFFDIGVCNMLAGRKQIRPKTELFGKAFEHLVFLELKAFMAYHKDKRGLSFWRSTAQHEVDFLIGDEIAIEVKGTEQVSEKHAKGLVALSEDIKLKQKIIVSMDHKPRKMGDVWIYPLPYFLERLWAKEF